MKKKEKILIVDDELNMRRLLKVVLSPYFELAEAANGLEALDLLQKQRFSVVILDGIMPTMDGWEVCKEIRKTNQIPILMLSGKRDIKDLVKGFSVGADDYLVKPFDSEELVVRLKALIQRTQSPQDAQSTEIFEIGDLKINRQERLVYVGNTELDFTLKEFDLIELLVLNPKTIFTRETLVSRVWGKDEVREFRTADTHIKNIRKKFRQSGLSFNPIRTVWGKGYQFQHSGVELVNRPTSFINKAESATLE